MLKIQQIVQVYSKETVRFYDAHGKYTCHHNINTSMEVLTILYASALVLLPFCPLTAIP